MASHLRRVVVAPDKFKGSVTAAEAAAALARGIRQVRPGVLVTEHPIADGGEGTVDAVVRAGYTPVEVLVTGPVGGRRRATYGLSGHSAVIEMASAAGLSCLPPPGASSWTARAAGTRGVGELVRHALDHGATELALGLGGSATTDGGAGAAEALGARVLDMDGRPLSAGGEALLAAARLDLSALDPRLRTAALVVACDVDNPLVGEHGAASVYGPQKGATPADVELLDAALSRWADVVAAATGRDLRGLPGAGAAGGLGFAAAALFGAAMRPGIDLVLELTGLLVHLDPETLVVVGEGSLDAQSLHGKGPVGVAGAARRSGAVTVAVAGRVGVDAREADDVGIRELYSLSDLEPDPARSMARAAELLERVGARIAADWLPVGEVEGSSVAHGLSRRHDSGPTSP